MTSAGRIDSKVLVIGTGIAGLTFALRAAEFADVVLVTKKSRVDSNTNYAQGGIAAVLGESDSFADHVADTIRVGAGLCYQQRVAELVANGPRAVTDLIEWGVRFSKSDGRLALGMEGGHSRPRIVHSQDLTGPAIETALLEAVGLHPRIAVYEHHMALSLRVTQTDNGSRCAGVWALDEENGQLLEVRATSTLLATGGAAALFQHTTNPAIATGDGVAMAYQSGAIVANMEFVQFHPTALYPAEERAFLITEALRGEGAVLRNAGGEAFMKRYDPRADLAPRDVVARAIHAELIATGETNAWLDATAISAHRLEETYPTVLGGCGRSGIDPRVELIPVVPAAHYVCGGVWTEIDGRTTLPGLFAAGECACTGVHGANRLASNSLLEAVVFSERAAGRIASDVDESKPDDAHTPAPSDLSGIESEAVEETRAALKRLMWERLGIVRAHSSIAAAASQLAELRKGWAELVSGAAREPDGDPTAWGRAVETSNMLEVAALIVRCALWRRESRGLHFDSEHPHRDNEVFLRDSILSPP